MGARAVHLVGIGGVGMSALAQAYLDSGCAVSGSDRSLRAGGVPTPVLSSTRQISGMMMPAPPSARAS